MSIFGKITPSPPQSSGLFGPISASKKADVLSSGAFGEATLQPRARASLDETRAAVIQTLESITMYQNLRAVTPVIQQNTNTCFLACAIAVARHLRSVTPVPDEASLLAIANAQNLMTRWGFRTAENLEAVENFLRRYLSLRVTEFGGTPENVAQALAYTLNQNRLALLNAPLRVNPPSDGFHWRIISGRGRRGFMVTDPRFYDVQDVSIDEMANMVIGASFLEDGRATGNTLYRI